MNKSVAEKALEGSLLRSLGDPRYFIMFSAFGLYPNRRHLSQNNVHIAGTRH